jgi:hypothetical protein
MTERLQVELDLGCMELDQPELRAILLLCTLQQHGPRHLSGDGALIEYVTTTADEKDDFYSAELYQAALSIEHGKETVALLAACQWLQNVKRHLASEVRLQQFSTEIAELKLTRIDDLVEALTRALSAKTEHDPEWDFSFNWPELEKALGVIGPDHVGGQPDGWIERIRAAATCPEAHWLTGLYGAAVADEGPESSALLAACGWIQRIKFHLAKVSLGDVSYSDVAKLHLVRVDELVSQLAAALQTPMPANNDDWQIESAHD